MQNQYLNYYKNHSEKELLEVVNKPSLYNDEARLAAYELLSNKGKKFDFGQTEDFESLRVSFKAKEESKEIERAQSNKTDNKKLPSWYSPTAILGFSIFLEPLFGAILLAHNLKKSKKNRQSRLVVIIGVIFLLGRMALVYTQRMNQIASLILSIGAGIIFIEFFWKKHLGYQVKYNRKPIWKPLLIFLGVIVLAFSAQMLMNPELFQQLLKQQQAQFAN